MQSLTGLHKNNGSIGYLPFNGSKDLLEYFNPQRQDEIKPSSFKKIMMRLKLTKPQTHKSKYSILEEPKKPYEFYPYLMDAVDSFTFYKSYIPINMYNDFAKLWLNDIDEKSFIKKLPQDAKDKYGLYKSLIYLFWRFLNNLPQDYKKKAIKQFVKRISFEV